MANALPARITDHLTKLVLFTRSESPDSVKASRAFGEEIFGVYRNDVDVPTRGLLLTDNGIHIQSLTELRYVRYHEIKEVLLLTWNQEALADFEQRHLMIYLHSGERLDVYVTGGTDYALDLMHMFRFLIGAIHVKRANPHKAAANRGG
jgi:hypothetical protein